MECGILGAGKIGRALGKHLTKAGHQVIVSNSRGPASLTSLVEELGPNAKAGTAAEAAAAPIVFITVLWAHLREALAHLPAWNGRVVVDETNPFIAEGPGFRPADLDGKTSSETVAELVPGARLVKAFNTLPVAVLAADPHEAGGHRVIFVSGDDAPAKADVMALTKDLGFAPCDLGGLSDGGKLQQAGGSLVGSNFVSLS